MYILEQISNSRRNKQCKDIGRSSRTSGTAGHHDDPNVKYATMSSLPARYCNTVSFVGAGKPRAKKRSFEEDEW